MIASKFLDKAMKENGYINRDRQPKHLKSRGWYICNSPYYLHYDGNVKFGVMVDSDKPAFWETEEEANIFFDKWKEGRA